MITLNPSTFIFHLKILHGLNAHGDSDRDNRRHICCPTVRIETGHPAEGSPLRPRPVCARTRPGKLLEPFVPTISCRDPARPPSGFLSGLVAHQQASNFWDTSEASPRDGLPGSHGNPSSLTVKPSARQPRHPAAPAAKPTRRFPNKRIDADCCCNRCHSSDNKRSRLGPQLQAVTRLFRRSAHRRNPYLRSASSGAQHPIQIQPR